MQLEVGKVYDGKVNGITKFGVFVDLAPGVKGMVHISEVANSFVEDIKDHIKEGQAVKVKVLSTGEGGKVALSIKKAAAPAFDGSNNSNNKRPRPNNRASGERSNQRNNTVPDTPEGAFEDMMNKFKQSSDERMSDLKKVIDHKRRSPTRRK